MENGNHQRLGGDEAPDSPMAFSVPTSLQEYIRRSVSRLSSCRRRNYLVLFTVLLLLLCWPSTVVLLKFRLNFVSLQVDDAVMQAL